MVGFVIHYSVAPVQCTGERSDKNGVPIVSRSVTKESLPLFGITQKHRDEIG